MDFVGLVVVVLIFGFPMYLVKRRYDFKEKQVLGAGDRDKERKELEALHEERKLLQERVENLESIVCSVDYELNVRIAQVANQQSAAALPAPMERTLTAIAAGDLKAQAAAARAACAPAELATGRILGKRYRVTRLIGRGGMGAVYLADDEVLGEPVALKVIAGHSGGSAELADRFRREASAARRVSHTNVIRIHDLGEAEGGLLYISMEYFPGKTLAEVLDHRGRLDADATRAVIGQVCDGLQAAHDAGVIHRDLKPHNVLVGERSAVKIIDFGLAKTGFLSGMTGTGLLLGTPYYMSPEQVRGRAVDARSDIYGLGALTYHAVAGRPPFEGDTPIAVGFAHCSETPRPPHEHNPDLSRKLSDMIMAALAKEPAARPQTPGAFKSAL